MRPLEGILIVDFSRAVSGPFCTMTLGDLGARVIKVEEPPGGDETRQWGPPFRGDDSTYFLSVNRNKESILLDLKKEEDRMQALRLAARADVVVENFRPGVADRLGIGYETLRKANEDLIYVSISGFGQTGPDRLKPGYDLIVQAMSGLMRVSATPGGPPVKTGFPVADVVAALFAGEAILAALFRRQRSGEGARIELSLLECLLFAMGPPVASLLMADVYPEGMGMGQANIAPYQVFETADEPIAVGVTNERIWERFCRALHKAEWLEEEKFKGNAARNRNRAELIDLVHQTLRGKPASEWLAALELAEVPCTAVLGIREALASRQLQERGNVVEIADPVRGPLRMMANPMRFSDVAAVYTTPPRAGEHRGENGGRSA